MNEVLALVLDFGSRAAATIRGIRETSQSLYPQD